eukprot:4747530-Pleurochrysis_carterae.AAC.1
MRIFRRNRPHAAKRIIRPCPQCSHARAQTVPDARAHNAQRGSGGRRRWGCTGAIERSVWAQAGQARTLSERAVWLHATNVIPGGTAWPGNVVAATVFANHVYTGDGGDIF